MTEYVMRFLNMLVARLLAQAERLARLAAARHEVTQYAAAYEEATALEASGKPALATFLRAEIEASIGSAMSAGPELTQPALGEGGDNRPFATGATFALEPPRPAEPGPSTDRPPSSPDGQGTPSTARRRGRRPKQAPAPQAPEQQQTTVGLFDPPTSTPTPVSNPNPS